jgi:hypothetical protein
LAGRRWRGCARVEDGVPNREAHMQGEIRAATYSPETLKGAAAGSLEPRRVGAPWPSGGGPFVETMRG